MFDHLEETKEEILKHLIDLDNYRNEAAKDFLFNLYYRIPNFTPSWIKMYSTEAAREKKLQQFIDQKKRCPGCLGIVKNYFNKYKNSLINKTEVSTHK